jgi:kynurenine formamidase
MVTGFGDLLQDASTIPKGVNEVVGKPFTIEELRGVIARIMAEVEK